MTDTEYKGFTRSDFDFEGHAGSVIYPKKCAVGKPWIWRAEFLGDFDQSDMELVHRGWHLVSYKVSDMYGCPEAVRLMHQFYKHMITDYKLNIKTTLFGFSRGGLYAVNYAVQYPEEVQSLYLDAPVIDMQSWPKQHSSEKNWKECLQWYGFNEQDAKVYSKTQLDRARVLAENKIPVLIITGDSDTSVPYEENAKPFINKYLETYSNIKVIIKKGCAHHPHSLDDVTPIIDFIIRNI